MTTERHPHGPAIFTFTLPDGSTLTGEVQGDGGKLARTWAKDRIEQEIRLAKRGSKLHSYEPLPGHVRVCTHDGALTCYEQADQHRDVDLRVAVLVSIA